jgi:hypothetical protein
MAKSGRTGKLAMNMSMIAHVKPRRWNGLLLGLIVAVMAHLSAATSAGRLDEPWPMLLSSEPTSTDPDIAFLHRRASGSLEKLVQSARAPGQPL